MLNVEVDLDVYKELTVLRTSENDQINDVLRRVLKLQMPSPNGTVGKAWTSEGVTFPHGTEFKGTRKNITHRAHIDDGKLVVNGKGVATGFSPAVKLANGKGENGWKFWYCKRPGDTEFILIDMLRQSR